jgi:protocatechuate 3,4-dioxygenase beta subunit
MILPRRRALVGAALALPFAARGQACAQPTPRDMEGPFYKAGAPMRASIVEPGSKGERLALSGRVLAGDCKPVPGALLDFWQADENGDYDNAGFRYRGKVAADAGGHYRVETILPPPYMGRPRHIHVKLQRPGGRVLTTQLYFPGESRGADPALVVTMERGKAGLAARYDFVLG